MRKIWLPLLWSLGMVGLQFCIIFYFYCIHTYELQALTGLHGAGCCPFPTQFKVLWTPFLNLVHSCTDSAITQSAEDNTRKKTCKNIPCISCLSKRSCIGKNKGFFHFFSRFAHIISVSTLGLLLA